MRNGMLIDWTTAGALLAAENNEVQAEFFKGFLKEILTWPTAFQREMQLLSINNEMSEEEKDLLSCLGHDRHNNQPKP